MAKQAAKTTAVAVREEAGLPAFLANYRGETGQETIAQQDVAIPRIKLGQAMSDEVKSKDVAEGDLFLNIDGTVLAQAGETLEVIIVARATEFILWRDRKDGGGIMARAPMSIGPNGIVHRWNKPNEKFENKIGGVLKVTWQTGETVEQDGLGEWGSENPDDKDSGIAATKHHNYVVYLPAFGMIAALSLQKSSAKVAKALNAMLMLGNAPIFARKFTVKSVDDKSDAGSYKNFQFKPAGFVDEATFATTTALFERFKTEGFTVDQSDEDQGDGGSAGAKDDGRF